MAALTGVHRTRVSNWKRSKDVGGTGGRIPQSHHATLLRAARERGFLDITADMLVLGVSADGAVS